MEIDYQQYNIRSRFGDEYQYSCPMLAGIVVNREQPIFGQGTGSIPAKLGPLVPGRFQIGCR